MVVGRADFASGKYHLARVHLTGGTFLRGASSGTRQFLRLAPAYLGLPSNVPPEMVSAAFEVIPRLYVFPLLLYLLFSLALMVGLYLRWKPSSICI